VKEVTGAVCPTADGGAGLRAVVRPSAETPSGFGTGSGTCLPESGL